MVKKCPKCGNIRRPKGVWVPAHTATEVENEHMLAGQVDKSDYCPSCVAEMNAIVLGRDR